MEQATRDKKNPSRGHFRWFQGNKISPFDKPRRWQGTPENLYTHSQGHRRHEAGLPSWIANKYIARGSMGSGHWGMLHVHRGPSYLQARMGGLWVLYQWTPATTLALTSRHVGAAY